MSIREDARNGILQRESLEYEMEVLRKEVRALRKQNQEMKHELLWIIEEVWPLVHRLTSRQTLKARFLRLNDFFGRRM